MANLPDTSNFHSALDTNLSRQQIAELFRPLATRIRKRGWEEFEVFCPWAELIIEAESPILMHGTVANVLVNTERILLLLREAGVAYSAECYGESGKLLQEYKWGND
jgi:hypothetical protein